MKKLPKVLVNDDEKEIVALVREALSERGIESIASYSCEEAWELIQTEKPDILITDIRFPGMGGIDLIQKILSSKIHLPVIAMSGHEDLRNKSYPFWPKPFSPSKMADFIFEKHEIIGDHQFLTRMADKYSIPISKLGRVLVFFAEKGWGLIRISAQDRPIYVNARDIISEA